MYSSEPSGPSFPRSTKIRVRGERIQAGIWDLVLIHEPMTASRWGAHPT